MNRTGHSSLAWTTLVGFVLLATLLGSSVAAHGQNRDFDLFGHGCAYALPPPDLDSLCLFLDEPLVEPSVLFDPEHVVTDDGYRLPLASRAPPSQA